MLFGFNSKVCLAKASALAAFVGLVGAANANIVAFNFDSIVSGTSPSGSNIATLTIADTGLNTVLVTLSHNSTSAAGQFISDLWFNIDPFQMPTQTNLIPANKFQGGLTGSQNGVGSAGVDFDLRQQFEVSNAGGGVNRLKPGESASFNLSGPGLDANDFLALSGGNRTDLYAMIHLQGLPNGQSVKLGGGEFYNPVPEPATMAIFGLGAAGLFAKRRAKK